MFEMLTGKVAFFSLNRSELYRNIVNNDVVFPP